MISQMAVELRSPSKSGKYPQYSFQQKGGAPPAITTAATAGTSSTVMAHREAQIRDKIIATKQELNQVLNQLDEFDRSDEKINLHDTTHNASRRRDMAEKEGS